MNRLKRLLCLILAFSMIVPMIPTPSFASKYFPDMVGHWAAEYVDDMYEHGVVKGYSGSGDDNGKFLPNNSINIGEFAAMLDRYYYEGFDRGAGGGKDFWRGHVDFLEDMGILPPGIDGFGTLTREIAVYAVVSCIDGVEEELAKHNYKPIDFPDITDKSSGFWAHINFATMHGVLNGYPDGTFQPKRNITRAETAKILFQVKYEYSLRREGDRFEIPEVEPLVEADLELDAPRYLTWNYREFEDNEYQYLDLELDASNTHSNLPIDEFYYEILIDGYEEESKTTNKNYYDTSLRIYPEDINGDLIFIDASVTVTDEVGTEDTAMDYAETEVEIVNEKPTAFFINSSPNYATLPVTFTNRSSDPEDDFEYISWTIENSKGDLIFYSDTTISADELEQDYTESYFSEVNFDEDGGKLTFTQEGYYDVTIEVWDNGGGYGAKSDTYTKTIYVNSEPQPPIADFNMYEFGFPNESVSVTDRSTDPNNDITQWIWTKPTKNKDDDSPASVSGSLSGSGGTLTFTKEGTYDVSLKVIDYTGLEDSITKEIKIIPPIAVARITAEGTFKQNRKVTLHSRDSLSPRVDPIDNSRNIWEIKPLDGQDPNSIKIDTDTSNLEEKNIVFKETGRYEVYLKVHNKFSDENPTHPNISASEMTEIITITEDIPPVSDFTVGGSKPNFFDNPISTKVAIKESAYSLDADIIDKYRYVVYRDMDEDGDFSDESVYGTYNVGETDIIVTFQEGVSGLFKVDLEVTEKFGQPTIEKFVSASDRRKAVSSKTFSVDWRPDIKFNIPDWAYTDDTLNFSTQLKDEKVDKLNVKWSIKRASETDTSKMVADNINSRTEYTLDNNGGSIRFKDSGYYELVATVTDEIGQSYTFSDFIRIYPLPSAVIKDAMSYRGTTFTTKENRKYQLNGDSSYAHDYYGPEMHSIDRSQDYWEIIPLDGQNANQVIKVANGSGSLASDVASASKYEKRNNEFKEDLLFKLKGRYKVRYQVTNSYGKKSPFVEQIITVVEDTAPIINFDAIETTYRDVDDAKRAELVAYNLTSSSNDYDTLENAQHRVRYRFDADNDGNFEEHSWSSPLTINFTNKRATVKVPHVGRYQFEFFVKDTFGQPTLSQFVTDADRRTTTVYKEVEVDNMAPNVDFTVTPSNKVDVVFTIGETDSSKTKELNSKINNYIKAYLEANNADFIDTEIQMIETSTVSSDEQGAENIFNNWRSVQVPQNFNGSLSNISGGWAIEGNRVVATGGYRPARAWIDDTPAAKSKRDIDIDFTWGIKNNASSFSHGEAGFMFRIKDDRNYYVYIMDNHSACGNVLYNGAEVLVKVTNGSRQIIATNSFPTFHAGQSHNIRIETKGNNIKIYRDNSLRFDYTDTNNPHTQGSYGFYVWDQLGAYFSNIEITSQSLKTLDEVLKEPNWRDDATRFIVNISDVKLPELEPSSSKYPVVLSRMLNDELYFAELGTSTNRSQALNFVADNDGKGTFIYNNNPNMDKALQDLGKWILDVVRTQARPTTQYILLNEEINYTLFYQDYEKDPQYNTESWKYSHDHTYFENSLGQVNYHDIWLTESKASFDKVGKFVTEYQTKDNPVGSDNRFDEYRKTSQMMNGPLKIFVHRKPIATFKANIVKSGSTFTISYVDNSYDPDHQSLAAGYYRLNANDDIVKGNSSNGRYVEKGGIVDRVWEWKEVGQTKWNKGQLTSGQTTKEYLVRLRVRDMDGENLLGAWSDNEVVLITNNPQPPIAQFSITPTTVPIEQNLVVTDSSYDPNGDPIVQWEWKLYKDGNPTPVGTYTASNPSTSINSTIKSRGIGDYRLTLQVRDNSGSWGNPLSTSEIYTQTFKVIPVNHSPVASFNPTPNPAKIYDNINWNASYSDPDADNTGFDLSWTLERYEATSLSGINGSPNNIYSYTGSSPFSGSFESKGLPYGAYRIRFTVTDKPPIPPYQATDPITVFATKDMYVLPRINITSSYEGDATNGNTITLKATTNEHVTSVRVIFLGQTKWLTLKSQSGGVKHWELDVAIPSNNTLLGNQTAAFRAYCNYGGMGSSYYVDSNTTIYVKPILKVVGSFEGEAITGETIKLKAETTQYANSVTVEFLGHTITLNNVSTVGDTKYWEKTFVIPEDLEESGTYPAIFTAKDSYGQTATDTIGIFVVALKLMDYRITNMVNHTDYSYPLTRVSLPVNYKAGYNVTFRINAKGNPISVKAKVYAGGTFDEEINLVKVGTSGSDTIWEGVYYSDPSLPMGTAIKMDLTAYKGSTTYNYNLKEGWNGIVLIVDGTAFEDGRINRTN